MIHRFLFAAFCLSTVAGAAGLAQSPARSNARVTPGELVVDPPTLINLGFEWLIDGDANRNASVDVSYRKVGETAWKKGMPLLRLQGERVDAAERVQPRRCRTCSPAASSTSSRTRPTKRASCMTDPDGIGGPAANATKTVTVRTRPEPKPADGRQGLSRLSGRLHRASGSEPSFTGIMCAYNYYCGAGDTAPGGRPRVKPGDIILMHAGTYAYQYEYYANQTTINATTTFEGTYYLTADGTPERPIVIKAAGDGEVIIDGRGNFNLFNVKAADYNYFEGITFRNTDIAIWAGTQFIAGSKGLTVKRCTFDQVGLGVFSNYSGSSNFYIADSTFLGRNDCEAPDRLERRLLAAVQRRGRARQFPPVMKSYTAIRLYGPGHVVAYNYVADFHDGIDTDMYGMPDGSHANEGPTYPPREFWDRRPVSIDIYNNYITNAHDNSIEMDGSMHNIRLMRNVLINSASHPMSTQPSVGGPIYWIRNIVYHAPGGSTRIVGGVAGRHLLPQHRHQRDEHRRPGRTAHWRNNLILGQSTAPAIFSVTTSTPLQLVGLQRLPSESRRGRTRSSGSVQPDRWTWRGAGRGRRTRRCGRRRGRAAAARPVHDAGGVREGDRPGSQQRARRLRRVRQRAEARSRSEDRAASLQLQRLRFPPAAGFGGDRSRRRRFPNVNDGFTGKAPDLGALEAGQPLPIYGPRPLQ